MFTDTNHYSLQITHQIKEISDPLFKQQGINAFFYSRIYATGETFLLTSHYDWYYHHSKNEYSATPPIPNNLIDRTKCTYFVTPYTPYQQVLNDIRSLFNLDHLFYIFKKTHSWYDIYCFSTFPENFNIINTYLNKMEIFDNFIDYFTDTAKPLIKESKKNTFLLPSDAIPNYISTITEPNKNITLSKQEKACLKYLFQGRTMKEVAKILSLSPRTVEFYLSRIKVKLNCRTKSELIDCIIHFNLLD